MRTTARFGSMYELIFPDGKARDCRDLELLDKIEPYVVAEERKRGLEHEPPYIIVSEHQGKLVALTHREARQVAVAALLLTDQPPDALPDNFKRLLKRHPISLDTKQVKEYHGFQEGIFTRGAISLQNMLDNQEDCLPVPELPVEVIDHVISELAKKTEMIPLKLDLIA